ANCRTVGRNGLHRYNNQDHAMLTGLYAARNLLWGEGHDLWNVSPDAEYLEQVVEERPGRERVLEEALAALLSRLDPVALGAAAGILSGLWLALATLALVLRGGTLVGPHLGLLGQYLPGYTVTTAGAALGLAYGLALGFLGGCSFAQLRNSATRGYVRWLRGRSKRAELRRLL